MSESSEATFVEAMLAAPAALALLARLEAAERADVAWHVSPPDSDPAAVERAVRTVGEMTFGELVAGALDAAVMLAGPWMSEAPASLAAAYRSAPARRAIAAAIAERFTVPLHAGAGPEAQEWWCSDRREPPWPAAPLFVDFDAVYGNGEITWGGLWTVSDPPPEAHAGLIDYWELHPLPITRWRLPVRPGARLWRIDRPEDWVRLVEEYPRVATQGHMDWALPGPNRRLHEVAELLAVPGQHAARHVIERHLLPDWTAVAADVDGVHLSWAGFLTSEGFVSDLGGGWVTMLRYWASERTLWLHDVFGEPVPLGAPDRSVHNDAELGVDVRHDEVRQRQDRDALAALLGR